jgi:2-dehydropantoate 2-reductase
VQVKIGIVGTGAMGSVYAAHLGRAGHEVWAIDIWDDHVRAIEAHGLAVSGASGTHVVDSLHVGRAPDDAGPCDEWIIGTKAGDVEEACKGIVPLLRDDDVVIAFQNGLGAGERVARLVPEAQVLVGIAEGFGSSIPEPGHVHHSGMRLIRLGELHGGRSDRLDALAERWRQAGFNVRAFENIERMVWEKFLCNVTLSAPCAAFDVTVGELMADDAAWAVALGCMLEAHRLGQALGVPFSFDDPVAYVTEFSATIPDASPSMRLDHLAGRPSEIDVINGQAVELSRPLGLATPYNETLCALLRRREAAFTGPGDPGA